MRRFTFILILLLFAGLDARSVPDTTEEGPGTTMRFVNYGSADGLPSNTVYAIAQDESGVLWIGTRNGLASFDGRRFCVPKDVQAFCASEKQHAEILDEHPLDREERLMLGLRLSDGVPEHDLTDAARHRIPPLMQAGYLSRTAGGNIALTPKGFAVSNAVIAELI